MKKHLLFIFLIFAGFSLRAQFVITSFTPESGPVGTVVTINGSGFSTSTTGNIVLFGAVKAQVTAASSTSLKVIVPYGADYRNISVTIRGGFFYEPMTAWSGKPFIVTFPLGGNFAAKVDYPAGSGTASVTTGDFNNDGITDLAVADNQFGANTVSVLMGKSDGTFASHNDYLSGTYPSGITTADFNNDGTLDLLATSNYPGNTVSLLQNNNGLSFSSLTGVTTGSGDVSIATGDFNGNGNVDFAVANYDANTISVLLGNGNGSFNSRTDYSVGSGPVSIAAADFNGDGKPDLAVANYNDNTITVLINNGAGSFTPSQTYSTDINPHGITAGDFNGDGKMDLAVVNYGSNTVSVFLSNGDGTFAPKVNYPTGSNPYGVTAGDFNGDGKVDLAVANFGSNTVSVLLGRGDGTFIAKMDYAAGKNPYAITSGDFNGDGKTDLAVTNFNSGTVSVLMNIQPPPRIESFTPVRAGEGATITIGGMNFTGATAVSFGGTPAKSFTVVNNDTIQAVVGSGSSGNVSVTTPEGTHDTTGFTFVLPPSNLSYKVSNVINTYDVTMDTDSAVVTGVVDSYSISPALPAGLTLDTVTGNIGGIPTVLSPKTNYTVTATNVAGKTTASLAITVNKKNLTVAGVVAHNKVYDGNNYAYLTGATLVGVAEGDTVNLIFADSLMLIQSNVGKDIPGTTAMRLGGKDAGNYTLTQPSGLYASITPKTLNVAGAVAANKVYDGKANAVVSGATLTGVVSGDIVTLNNTSTGTFAQTDAGTGISVSTAMTLGGKDSANYQLAQPAGLTADITAAPLTVTADNLSKVYDGSVFNGFTVSYNGFVNGEDKSVLSGTLNFSGSATTATDAGTGYVITPGGLTSNNYKITFVNGSLTIEKADQTIQFSPLPEKQEGNNDFQVTATSSSGLPVTFSSSDNSIATVQGNTVTIVTAGTCNINANQAGNNNYNPAPQVSQPFTVTPFGNRKRYQYLFTPNGDGINDYWRIPNIVEMGRVKVKIFDRWGSMVYHSSDYHNDWNGTYKGKQLPTGAYIVVMETQNLGTETGVINLVR